MLVLSGPPGAGKTTVARSLAARFERSVHVEADRFFDFIAAGRIEPWQTESHTQNQTVMGIVGDVAAAYADAGYMTIVEGIVIPRWFLEPLREALHAAGHRTAYAVLRVPLTTCLERVRGRDGALSDPAVVERLWNEFADLGQWEGHAIEVGDASPDELAARTAEKLDSGDLLSP